MRARAWHTVKVAKVAAREAKLLDGKNDGDEDDAREEQEPEQRGEGHEDSEDVFPPWLGVARHLQHSHSAAPSVQRRQ
jgi:hypothetical protein